MSIGCKHPFGSIRFLVVSKPLILAASMILLAGAAHARNVWIDTDPSVQRGVHEVDDGFALLQIFHSKELDVRGISVVFGNAPLEQAFPIGEKLVRQFGPPQMRIFKGAAGPQELGVETDASRALAAALRKERLTILVLGPATNVATVLRNHPELAPRIEQVIAVAGRRPGQKFRPSENVRSFRDFNFELDAPAFQVLLDSGVKLVLAPWEISSKVWLTSEDLDDLLKSDPSLGDLIDAARDWLAFWKRDLKTQGFNPFDTLAVGYAISPATFRCQVFEGVIRDLADDTVAAGNPAKTKPYFLMEAGAKSHPVTYCFDAGPQFKDDLMRRLRPGKLSH
jgi:inosine-uridine nucleoside N-ribohydrolase